jgi:hypothetical protein
MMSDFGDIIHHKGRKGHHCEWCGEPIPKGETFAHYKGMWQDEWQNWRMHEECYEAYRLIPDIYNDEGFEPYAYKRGSGEPR